MRSMILGGLLGSSFAFAGAAAAGEADVLEAEVEKRADGTYRFCVTVRHEDEGWEHYANEWNVVGPDGVVHGTRVLAHPHVEEQPFTRCLSGVEIPSSYDEVTINAVDSVHEDGGKALTVKLPE